MIIENLKPFAIKFVEFVKQIKDEHCYEKISCAGRLDPLAQGKIIVLTDNDTKKTKEYISKKKTYTFQLIIGIETESHDCLSDVLQIINCDNCNAELIKNKLCNFTKDYIKQKYPLVSSYVVKHNGIKNPLWWFYKNNYRNIKLPTKEVDIINYKIKDVCKISFEELSSKFIKRLNTVQNDKNFKDLNVKKYLFSWDELSNIINTKHIVISMEMTVSSGFYIRRFCHDFGLFINNCAIAFDITRINYN